MAYINREIAEILAEIGEMLDLQGANPFRVRAYERAADTITYLAHELEDVYTQGGLKALEEIEGIGPGIGKKIETYLKTGTLKYYEDLKKKVPETERELMDIPGVGPKTARKLYEALQPTSITDLVKQLKSGRGDEFFGEKTIANILAGIQSRKRVSGRYLLAFAEPIAREIVTWLKEQPGVKDCEAVGSLRRMLETVGDIDILVTTTRGKEIVDGVRQAPFVRTVLAAGSKKISFVHRSGIQIDIEIVPPTEYGSLLQHFTGSKDHNIALRTRAETVGLSISEHGIKNKKTGRTSPCATEKEVYERVKLPLIPPELRENRGEFEAAERDELPNLFELKDVRGNLHIHTDESDGQLPLAEIVRCAADYGYNYIAITDHSKGLGVAGGLDEQRLAAYRDAIHALDRKYRKKGMRILAGVELNLLASGEVDIDDATLESLDFVIASIHSSFRQSKTEVTDRLLAAIHHPHIDCLAHPSGRLLGKREGVDANWGKIFEAAAETGTLLEINASPDRLDLSDVHARQAVERGVTLIINTDAHHDQHFDHMRYGVAVARRAWLTKDQILNSWPTNHVMQWLGTKKEARKHLIHLSSG